MKNILRLVRYGGFLFVMLYLLTSANPLHAQWIQTNAGLTNTDVYALAVSPNGAGGTNLFAGTYYRGVFLSTNNGTSWTAVNNGLTNTYVQAFAVSPNGAGGTNIFAGTWNGVFLSTDNGTNWTAVNSGLTNTSVLSLAVSGTNLFAGTYGGGVFLSSNNGTSWTPVNTGLPTVANVLAFAVSPNGAGGTNIFAGTSGGIFLSTDNGTSWSAVGLTNIEVKALAGSGMNIIAGTWYSGVFLSTDNGTSWTAINMGLPTHPDVNALAISPNGAGGTNIFVGTWGSGVFLSTNNGTQWTWFNNGLAPSHLNVYSLAVSGPNLFVGTDSSVWRRPLSDTTNPAVPAAPTLLSPADGAAGVPIGPLTWIASSAAISYQLQVSTNSSLSTTVVNQSGISSISYVVNGLAGSTTYYWRVNATGEGGTSVWSTIWKFTTGKWVQTNGTNGGAISSFTVSGSNLFAGADGGGIFLSTNNGTSWTAASTGLTNYDVTSLAVSDTSLFAGTDIGVFLSTNNGARWVNTGLVNYNVKSLAVSGPNLFAGTSNGLFLSASNGASWTMVDSGLTNSYVTSLAVSTTGAGGTNIFAGTLGGGVFISTNNGTRWTVVRISRLPSINVYALATSGMNLSVGTDGGGVYLSTNNGTNWTAVKIGLTNNSVSALAFSGTNLFAGTDGGGVYLSTNNGTSWNPVNTDSMDTFYVTSLFVIGTNLFVGTSGGSVWRRPLSEMTAIKYNGNDAPMRFSLSQNYPNPFNPTTSINYQLPMNRLVLLKVYDVLGREVKTLVSERQIAGNHSVIFDANSLPSGVYFYRLQAGSYAETKKLVLLK